MATASIKLMAWHLSESTLDRVHIEQGLHADRALKEGAMKTLHKRCAGLDVHKKEVVACLRLVVRGKANYEVV